MRISAKGAAVSKTHWQDWDDLFLGLWVFISPWVFGFPATAAAAHWSAWILGAAITLVAVVTLFIPRAWDEPVTALLGLCLILSPWVLGFSDLMTATSASFVAGVLVIALSCWAMVEDGIPQKWWREHHHARTH